MSRRFQNKTKSRNEDPTGSWPAGTAEEKEQRRLTKPRKDQTIASANTAYESFLNRIQSRADKLVPEISCLIRGRQPTLPSPQKPNNNASQLNKEIYLSDRAEVHRVRNERKSKLPALRAIIMDATDKSFMDWVKESATRMTNYEQCDIAELMKDHRTWYERIPGSTTLNPLNDYEYHAKVVAEYANLKQPPHKNITQHILDFNGITDKFEKATGTQVSNLDKSKHFIRSLNPKHYGELKKKLDDEELKQPNTLLRTLEPTEYLTLDIQLL